MRYSKKKLRKIRCFLCAKPQKRVISNYHTYVQLRLTTPKAKKNYFHKEKGFSKRRNICFSSGIVRVKSANYIHPKDNKLNSTLVRRLKPMQVLLLLCSTARSAALHGSSTTWYQTSCCLQSAFSLRSVEYPKRARSQNVMVTQEGTGSSRPVHSRPSRPNLISSVLMYRSFRANNGVLLRQKWTASSLTDCRTEIFN